VVESLPVLDVDRDRLREICARYGIAALWVFGSIARGSATPESDVDLLYVLLPGRRLGWDVEQLSDELADLFGRPVDLVSRAALHARLRPAVLAEAREFYAA
jgi:uncharacterized protein